MSADMPFGMRWVPNNISSDAIVNVFYDAGEVGEMAWECLLSCPESIHIQTTVAAATCPYQNRSEFLKKIKFVNVNWENIGQLSNPCQ